jgi:hypothetical protein
MYIQWRWAKGWQLARDVAVPEDARTWAQNSVEAS